MATHEQRLVDVEANVNQLKGAYEHLATKADLANLENRLTRWIVGGIALVIVGVVANIFVQLWTS